MYLIQNDRYRITLKADGAELCSFLDTEEKKEFMWQADPQVWPRHAPILFPIVGRLQEDTFTYQGETYRLPQHGFARDQTFAVAEETDNSLLFELRESAETLKQYPFSFVLQVKYVLERNTVTVGYRVHNPGEDDMYFSIGGHPGFNCPLQAGEMFNDYYLEFDQPETLERYLVEEGLLTGETEKVMEDKRVLPLRDDLFAKDALVLKEFASNQLTLRSNKHPHQVNVRFKNFPYLGIWSKPVGASFLCIEPWFGVASTIGSSSDLTKKEGILHLAPGQDFTCSYAISIS
jgi:galactose mutarotase-like enzyme